ncbi:MAG TPA: response regulator transcription factor [Candidatus Hydrogenedentes bacterium]|nr:response regulator transcription factor [Candidatus Hydrogenedentota bacterium]HOS03092.1 response regulator transcription factor [Candidatus Hydrogenedentota bacterium]
MDRTKVLIVDDDAALLAKLNQVLHKEGFAVESVQTGENCLERLKPFAPDLLIIDIVLTGSAAATTGMDGMELLRRVRQRSSVPVIMLTRTSIGYVKVAALTIGADDYLTKPFDPEELVARARAILRRTKSQQPGEPVLKFRRLRIDPGARRVWKDDAPLALRPLEYDLLYALAKRPGQVYNREQLINRAWKHDHYGDERVVDVHMGRLRKKIEDDSRNPRLIVTVRGAGYRFEDEPVS